MISIIIPFRNEAGKLEFLLKDLMEQSARDAGMEIIMVDDHSTDGGNEIIRDAITQNPGFLLKIIDLPTQIKGKKAALKAGVEAAKGEILLFSDADTRIPPQWATRMAHPLADSSYHLVLGPVGLKDTGRFIEKIQVMEAAAFLQMGRLSRVLGTTLLASAASLGITKETLLSLGDDPWKKNFISGDDIFLLSKVQQAYGKESVVFLDNADITVFTDAVPSFHSFIMQRARWVSKNFGVPGYAYRSAFALVALSNLIPVLFTFLLFTSYSTWTTPFLIAWILKIFSDALLIYPGLVFLGRKRLFWCCFLPASLAYPFLASGAAVMSILGYDRWKGR